MSQKIKRVLVTGGSGTASLATELRRRLGYLVQVVDTNDQPKDLKPMDYTPKDSDVSVTDQEYRVNLNSLAARITSIIEGDSSDK